MNRRFSELRGRIPPYFEAHGSVVPRHVHSRDRFAAFPPRIRSFPTKCAKRSTRQRNAAGRPEEATGRFWNSSVYRNRVSPRYPSVIGAPHCARSLLSQPRSAITANAFRVTPRRRSLTYNARLPFERRFVAG